MSVADTPAAQAQAAPAAAATSTGTWNTGLFEVTADLESFVFTVICMPLVAVENKLAVKHEQLPVQAPGFCANVGCIRGDTDRCANLCLFGCCACCIYPFWRSAVREKYGIQGSLVADCVAWCCCGPLAVMQDRRLIKANHH